ncbi:MAG: glutaredoxin family protein [Candidatus Promineifilaceae bacterium]|nr:glutaredoxin family protein [Candidatus Promineifilaceae bacterium]
MTESGEKIILYTSNYCGQALLVERFFENHDIPVDLINIDGNTEARQQLIELNNGYASVPTLIFPDGTQMTEPRLRQIQAKLGMEPESLGERLRNLFD